MAKAALHFKTAIVIASRKVMIPGIEAVSTPTGDIAIIRSERGVLQSRILLDEVAARLHRDGNPEFNPLLRPKDDSLLAWLDPRRFLQLQEWKAAANAKQQIYAGFLSSSR